jgi:Domain of unknown function (DUF4328)
VPDTVAGVSDPQPPPTPGEPVPLPLPCNPFASPPVDPFASPPTPIGGTSTAESKPLRRVAGLALSAMIIVGLAAAAGFVMLIAGRSLVTDAEAFLDGDLSRTDFEDSIGAYVVLGQLQVAARIAAAVVVIVWMYRIADNHRRLGRVATWQPGWAIGGWFLPPVLNLIPYLVFRELWRASDPEVLPGGDWREGPVPWPVTAWFVAFGPLQVVAVIASASFGFDGETSPTATAERIVDGQGAALFGVVVGVTAAVSFVLMAHRLTGRHRRLIGES